MILPDNWLKEDSNKPEAIMASRQANTQMRMLSPINCLASCGLPAPTTFRMPTSLALSADRARGKIYKVDAGYHQYKQGNNGEYIYIIVVACLTAVAGRIEIYIPQWFQQYGREHLQLFHFCAVSFFQERQVFSLPGIEHWYWVSAAQMFCCHN